MKSLLERRRSNEMLSNGNTSLTNPRIEHITPDEARKMLSVESETGIRQRPVNDRHVAKLATQMKKGNWCLQYEPIIISRHGFILDGQHRLNALIKSGTTQPFLVVYDADESLMPKIGIGRKRTNSDVLAMHEYKNSKLLASILRYLWVFYEKGSLSPDGKTTSDSPSEYEYLDLAEKYPGAIQAASYASAHNRTGFLTGVQLGTLWYILGQVSYEDRNHFFGKLISGVNLEDDDPVFVCREKLIKVMIAKKSRGMKADYKSTDIMALVIKSWNAMREGKTIKQLYFRSGESYPKPI